MVAKNTWTAMQAAERVHVDWNEGANASASTDAIVERQKAAVAEPEQAGFTKGEFSSAFADAPIQLDREFSAPFLCHSPMEPPNCAAWFRDGGLEIWTGCQSLNRLYDALPGYTGLPHDRIAFHQLRIGGGFGRKLAHDYIIEAVELARRVDYRVKLIFTKEDDIRHSVYRAADRYRYWVGMDRDGFPLALQEISCRAARARRESKFAVHFRHVERRFTDVELPLVSGPMRGPHDNVSCFTQQSMIDVMAEEAGIDPYLVESQDAPKGLGETAYPPTMPAVASALYDATGRRATDLPVFG